MGPITLTSGRTVHISHLEQSSTYAGVLCGRPDVAMNAERVLRIVEQGRRSKLGEPLMIAPVLDGDRLPPVACVACFDSTEIRSSDEPYSALVVVWFQHSFGEPDASVAEAIAAVDWDARATPWCW